MVHFLTAIHGAVRGSRQGLFPPRRFLCLHQPLGNDLNWPLSPTYPSWSGESAVAPAAGTSWPRLALQSSERSWRPLTLGNDLNWPLSPTYPSWSGESAAAPAAGTSWPRLALRSSERSWRPLTLDGSRWNVLYLISCQLRLIHSRSIDIWTSTALST